MAPSRAARGDAAGRGPAGAATLPAEPAPDVGRGERPRAVLPLAPEGWPFVLGPLALAGGLWVLGWRRAAGAAVGVAAFTAFFFRDPERTPPADPAAILAPADGRVVGVRAEVLDPFVGAAREVSIFLSPLDVHVNRSPVEARVVSVTYRPGGYAPAYRADAAARNEQAVLALEGPLGRLVVRQVAGVLARRVICRVRPGDALRAGERFGLIRFGSRVDVLMPVAARLRVGVGDRVRAGETVLAVVEGSPVGGRGGTP